MTKYKHILDSSKAVAALNEGFTIVCGEKHREFLTKLADQIVNLGMINSVRWANDLVIKADKISTYFTMVANGIIEQSKVDDIVKGLELFFTDEQIELLKFTKDCEIHSQLYMQGLGKFEMLIVDTIKKEDMTCKNPIPFFYFKEFPVSAEKQFASCTLYNESGLGLDEYKPSSMKYYKEEGELCYPIENICRKYHYLGMLLGKQEILLKWVDKIKQHMKPETNYFVRQFMSNIIYKLALGSIADEIIHDVQSVTGVTDAFKTHDQVRQSISKLIQDKKSKKKLDDLTKLIEKKE